MSAENQYTVHQGLGPDPYPPHQHAAVTHHAPFPGPASATGNPGFGYREHHVNFGGSAGTGEMMTGVVGGPPVHHPGPHPYAYHDYIDPSHRPPPQSHPTVHHPPPPPPPGQPQWHEPNYGNGVHTPMPEGGPPGKPGISEGPPISPHHTSRNWDKPQNGYIFNKSPSQDSNEYPQHSSVPSPQNQRHSQPALNRTIEPNAAPSPPTQYPGSPRTPLPQQMGPPAPGLPLLHKSHRPQSVQRTSLSISSTPSTAPHDGLDHRTFVELPHKPPLRSPMEHFVPRHVNGGNPLAPPGLPSHQQQYVHHRQGSFGDSRPQIQHRHSSDGRMYTNEDIKRENGSRVPSVSMSPAPMVGEVENSPNSKMEGGETSKKRGVPAFRDPKTGIEYYENEYVPPDVLLPVGFQRGIGKQSQDLLLPLEKDGIQVNPEWGLTAGGKARQRLPAACRNCRQKKIKCVELENDETSCQHCSKMHVQCSWPSKEEEKKKKGRNTGEKIKNDGGRSSSISMPSNNACPSRFKKRKSSMEPSQESKKHNPGSVTRRGSVDTERANHYLPINSPTPYSAPPHLGPDVRPPRFPTLENGTSAHQTYESPEESRARYLMELRRNNYGPPTTGYPVASPQSFPPSSPTLSANSMGGPGVSYSQNTHAASSVQSYRSQSDTRDARSNHGRSSTPQTTSITSPMAMGTPMYKILDPNSSGVHLPPPAQFDMLVDTYFEHFYSQTYAFLHRPSFVKNLDQKPPILKFSICAVAARFTDDITAEAAEVWADATRTLILRQYDTYTLEVVQSMVHMGIHDFGTNNGQKAWMFAGMAVRMGSALNMNLEPKKKELSIIEREVYRRTYWAYYLMDRFNCYGVARAYLIQDHDCHVQLPCNQPSFEKGEDVGTELLDGPHPHHPNVGTQNMGAYAFLVRITCIWSNILRRIHFATLKKNPVDENDTLKGFSSKLDKWRNSLPSGLTYSVKNLAAQVDFGTTGAFVMMHVMWHMAMAYVHRYVRLGSMLDVNDGDNKKMIVTSIRKAFVHADTILQIMREVWELREATKKGDKPLIVNAPFLGQAIQDACVISAKRAMEVNNSPERYLEQIERVQQGLEWLSELKRYWVPINSQYNRVLKLRKQLDEIRNPRESIPVPVTEAKPQQDFSQVNPVAWTTSTGMQFDQIGNQQVMGNQNFDQTLMIAPDDTSQFAVPEFLSIPIPAQFYVEAFNHESYQTMETYATYESGFPHLYTPVVTTAFTDPTIPVSAHYHQITPPIIHEHQPFSSQSSRINGSGSGDDDQLGTSDITSGTKSDRDIHTTYFDAGAVHDGKLQDSGSDSSGRSRRASDSGGQAVKSMPTNRMDVLNLINTTGMDNRGDDVNGMIRGDNGAATL